MPGEPHWVQTACMELPRLSVQELHTHSPAKVSQVEGQGMKLPMSLMCMRKCMIHANTATYSTFCNRYAMTARASCMAWLGDRMQRPLLCQLHNTAGSSSSAPAGS